MRPAQEEDHDHCGEHVELESVLELEKDYVAAYQIQLANSEDLVYAPNDTDEYVRPYVDSPPAKRRKLDK